MSGIILVYGHDPTLLETRRLILEKAGFTVYNTTSFDDCRSGEQSNAWVLLNSLDSRLVGSSEKLRPAQGNLSPPTARHATQ
jgi:hypothetical protein